MYLESIQGDILCCGTLCREKIAVLTLYPFLYIFLFRHFDDVSVDMEIFDVIL